MAEDIKKKIQIVIETVTEEAKSKIKELDRAIDDLNRKTSAKAPAQKVSRSTDIKANKEEAESLKVLRAEMKAYISAANVLNKRELTKSVKSGITSLPKSMKETAAAIEDYTKKVEASYKTIEEAMGAMTPKQKEVFEQMIPQAKIQALKDYTSVTGKLGKQIDLTDSSSKKFHMNLRKDVTAALIGFHVMRILGNNSKVLDATFTGLSKTLGALLDVVLLPMLNVLEPMLNAIMGLTEWIDSWGQAAKDAVFFVIALAGAVLLLHKALQSFTGRGLWGENAFKPVGGKTIGGFLKEKITGKKAAGGPVLGQGAYIVGERGPELFVPGQSGTIIPHDKIHRQEGGDVVPPGDMGLLGIGGGITEAMGLSDMNWESGLENVTMFVGDKMSAIMESPITQALLSTISIVTSSISAMLAPIAPILSAVGLLAGVVGFMRGGKGGMGGGGRDAAAHATVAVGGATLKNMTKQGVGIQTAVNMGARGTSKMLTALMLCMCGVGMPRLLSSTKGMKGKLDSLLPIVGGIGLAISAWWATGFGQGSGSGTGTGTGTGIVMPEKEREEAGKGIAVSFVAYLEDQARIVARVIPVALATIEQYVKVKYLNPFISTLAEIIQRVNLKWNTYTVPVLRAVEEKVNLVWNRWTEPVLAPLVRVIRFANAAVTDPYLTPLQRAIRFVNAVVTDPVLSVLNRTIRYVNSTIIEPVFSTLYRTIYYVNSAVVNPVMGALSRTIVYVNSAIIDPTTTPLRRPVEFVNGFIVEPVLSTVKRTIEFVNSAITDPFIQPLQRAILFVNSAIVDPIIAPLARTVQYINGLITDPTVAPLSRLVQYINGVVTDPLLSVLARPITFVNGLIAEPSFLPLIRTIDYINSLIVDPVITPIARAVNYVNTEVIDPVVLSLKRAIEFVNGAVIDPIVTPVIRYVDFVNNPVTPPTLSPLQWVINFLYTIPLIQPLLTTLTWIIDLVWKLPTPEQLYGEIQKNVNSVSAGIESEGQKIGNWLWDGIVAAIAAFVGFESSLSSKLNEGISMVKDNQGLALAISAAIGFIVGGGLKLWESAQSALGAGGAIFGTIYRVIHDALVSLGINPTLETDTSNVLMDLWGTGTAKAAPTIIDRLKTAIVSWWGSVFPPITAAGTGGVTGFLLDIFKGGTVAAQSDITTAWKNLINNSSTEATVVQRPLFSTLLRDMIVGGATSSTAAATPTFSSLLTNMIKNATAQSKPAMDSIWTSVYSVDAAKRAAAAAANAAAIAAATAYGAAEAKEHGLIQTGVSTTGVPLYRAPTLEEQVIGTLATGQKYGYDKTGTGGSVPFVIQGGTIFTGAPAQGMITAAQGKTGAYWDFSKGRLVYPGDPDYSCRAAGKNALPGCKDGVLSAGTASAGGTADQFKGRHGGVVSTTTGVGGNANTMRMMMKDGSYIDSTPGGATLYYDASGKQVTASYQYGGFVKDTGTAFLHRGEYVIPKTEVERQTSTTKGGDIIINNPVFQISGKDDRELFESFMRLLKQQGRRLGGTV